HARQFQEKLAQVQEELAARMVTGTAGGGMVTVTVNGRGELIGLAIEPEVINPDDRQMLQDLVIAAVNDGLRKAKDLGRNEMSKLTGGMSIPGLF
ncbi:MAG: YbaB/EbfC family nucleoid-associated protein, partial [Deltaproteobacteria bacterium]|nr:YbaB/EbfC family nucleoid-associated protein [Deltaproteobacteria bacterium]